MALTKGGLGGASSKNFICDVKILSLHTGRNFC